MLFKMYVFSNFNSNARVLLQFSFGSERLSGERNLPKVTQLVWSLNSVQIPKL